MWDEIINAADSLSTNVSVNVICTVAINVANTASTNFDNRNVEHRMNCCILRTALWVFILLFIIAIIFYHYAKNGNWWIKKNVSIKSHGVENHMKYEIDLWHFMHSFHWHKTLAY